MFDKLIITVCLLLTSHMAFAARIVNDPQQDYLSTKVNKLTRDAYIYTLSVDLNEDGVMDYFYSSSAEGDQASRRGAAHGPGGRIYPRPRVIRWPPPWRSCKKSGSY